MSLMSRGLEHHLVGGYVRYISPHIIILLLCYIYAYIITYLMVETRYNATDAFAIIDITHIRVFMMFSNHYTDGTICFLSTSIMKYSCSNVNMLLKVKFTSWTVQQNINVLMSLFSLSHVIYYLQKE